MDRENDRCQVFDVDDNYLTEWANVPGPNDAVIDDDGIIHIATGHEENHVMSLGGKPLGTWNQRGESLPQYNDTLRI